MPAPASAQDTLIGLQFGHYRILERIGSGGMGVVYRGFDTNLEREVAIKVLKPGTIANDHSRKRFRNEAHALSKLNHPAIATVFDFHTEEGRDFLVMEFIDGVVLNRKLSEGSLPQKDVIAIGVQLADGLSAAHDHAVIHRDLKPGNLALTADGRLKILDFGLAKLRLSAKEGLASETLSETQVMAGTLAYMAPEQVLGGQIDARTDVHAAGTVLYQMATGLPPFTSADRSELMNEVLRSSPAPATTLNPQLSPELARIIAKCLERDPENRYQSAKELAIDLRRLQSGALTGTYSASKPSSWWATKTFRFGSILLVAAVVFLLAPDVRNQLRSLFLRTKIESLAVLPLANLSGDSEQEYFTDGMTDELITYLGKVGSLRVISRTSVMQYKNTKKTLPEIARELNVDAIVEGSVLRSGNRLRITAQLVQARRERHLWAEAYERDASDVLSLQSEVARAIAGQIQAKLTSQEKQLLAAARVVDPAAHEAYLRGRYLWDKMTEGDLEKARRDFEQAISIDPNYAPPYAGLADYYITSYAVPSTVSLQRAREYADRALNLDETLPEAHIAKGNLQFMEWDWRGAEQEFQRTLSLNPSYAEAHRRYSMYLSAQGRSQEAWTEIQRAQELDPFSVTIGASMGWIAYVGRDYDQAINQCKKILAIAPNNIDANECLGLAYLKKGMFEEAIAAGSKSMTLSEADPDRLVCLGQAYAAAGQTAAARGLLERLYQTSQNRNIPPFLFALLHAALGDKEKAFGWLEKSYRQRDPFLVWLKVIPAADTLRSDARMQELVHRVGLDP